MMKSDWKESSFHWRKLLLLKLILLFLKLTCVNCSLNTHYNDSSDAKPHQHQIINENEDFGFHPNYWRLVAQAMAVAKCLENGIRPALDPASLIMKPAACRKENKTCDKCLKDVGSLNATGDKLFADGSMTFYRDMEAPKPLFHCTSHVGAVISHSREFATHFRMDYGSIMISNISSDLLPRVFIVEKEIDGEWEAVIIQTYWLFDLDTKSRHTYRIRVTAVTPKHVYYPQVSEPIKLYDASVQNVGLPRNLRLVETSVNLKVARPGPTVLLRWESGSGKNASCDFDVFYMDDEQFFVKREKADQAFWVFLDNVKYGRNYMVRLIEKIGGGRESESAVLHFTVPSCLKLQNFSFDLCSPPKPRNIRLVNETENSFSIAWDPPEYHNATNQILTYDYIVEPYPLALNEIGMFKGQKSAFHGSVNGNETVIKIQNTTIKGKVRISISAISRGGKSVQSLQIFQLQGPMTLAKTLEKIWVVIVIVVVIIFFILVIFYLKNFRDKLLRKKEKKELYEKWDKEETIPTQQVDRYSSKWEIEYGRLVILEVVGLGNFGKVRKALLNRNGSKTVVAVKTLRDGSGETESEKFREEFDILKELEPHIHVVGLVGIVKEPFFNALVVEYCDGGDLKTFLMKVSQARFNKRRSSPSSSVMGSTVQLQSTSNEVRVQLSMVTNEAYFMNADVEPTLSTLDLLSFSRQIAVGMEFLSNNRIIHRDLAARNILICGPSRTLKIADFGLSRDVYEKNWYKKSSNGKIPFKWLAIESLVYQLYTTKSDVWSYGIVLYEIFTFGGNPYPGIENLELFDLLKSGYRMPKPDFCSDELYGIMMLCWEEDANTRPDFTSIRRKLEQIIERSNYVTYLNLDLSEVRK